MDTLPVELQQHVCTYLTPKDLKPLRLASKVYAAAACRYILPRIFLLNHPDSLQEVQDIVNHPELSQQVTTLVIDACRLKEYTRYEHWAYVLAELPPASVGNQVSVEGEATATGEIDAQTQMASRRIENLEKWQSYQIKARNQAEKSSEKLMLECVALAFRKCPKLRNLVIDFQCENRDGTGLFEKRNRFYCDIFLSSATRPEFPRRIFWDCTRFDSWDILKPVDDVNRALESLVILDDVSYSVTKGWTLPTTSIFRNLKHLRELCCSRDFLTYIVACAPKLEGIGRIDRDNFDILIQLIQSCLKCFRACSLQCFTNENAIVQFLLRQSKTFQSLTIRHAHKNLQPIIRTVWASLAARLQGQLPHLRRVKLIDRPGQTSRLQRGNGQLYSNRIPHPKRHSTRS